MGNKYLIGIDEVGRGPVAGPVYVCGVFGAEKDLVKVVETSGLPLRDSKKLTEKMRDKWLVHIKKSADEGLLKYAVSFSSAKEIDEKGVAVCIKACAQACVEKICKDKENTKVLLDGGLSVSSDFNQETFIKGDENIPAISLASIIAKVLRDKEMKNLSKEYPEFLLEKNKGYGTKEHLDAIKKYGLTEIHRKSFLKNYI